MLKNRFHRVTVVGLHRVPRRMFHHKGIVVQGTQSPLANLEEPSKKTTGSPVVMVIYMVS